MRVARFLHDGRSSWGFVEDSAVLKPSPPGLMDQALVGGLPELRRLRSVAKMEAIALSEVQFLAPLGRCAKLIGVGLNYRDHAAETGAAVPTTPILFSILPSSVIGPGEAIQLPPQSNQVDWEVELGIIIGARTRWASEASALECVLGYTIVNDVSARDIQALDGQWMRAKSFDTFTPLGPWVTTVDELDDAAGLGIRLWVNGELKQSSSTSELVFDVRSLVSICSQAFTLESGDIISSGTPSGVGAARNPPEFLRDGDEVALEIDGIGILRNPVRTSGTQLDAVDRAFSRPVPKEAR